MAPEDSQPKPALSDREIRGRDDARELMRDLRHTVREAEGMSTPSARNTLNELAQTYETLAETTEERLLALRIHEKDAG
jgi:hypothetical protein